MHERVILFDWGGTLMTSMPMYLGRGRGWSTVDAVEGVADIVAELQSSWTVGLASNAGESDEDEIRESLNTIGIGSFFDRIYTYRLIGKPKPWAEFWMYILRDLDVTPQQIVMVGDDYMADVWGPTQVGMKAVWVNLFSDELKHGHLHRTITAMNQLPDALRELGFVW